MKHLKHFSCLFALIATVTLSGCGGGDTGTNSPSILAVIGDSPYGASNTDTAEFLKYPSYIAAINSDKDVSMVLHTGDIHSGKQNCTQEYNQSIFNYFNSFATPLIFTPGDNEWIDCQKVKEGGGTANSFAGGDPLLNLDLVRSIFFSQPG
jgi:hypothetical protein